MKFREHREGNDNGLQTTTYNVGKIPQVDDAKG